MRGLFPFLTQRLFRGLIALWLVSTVVFVLMRRSGDPVPLLLPPDAPRSEMERLRRELGLDRPLPVQYAVFLDHTLRLDFGRSLHFREPAFTVVRGYILATLELARSIVLEATLSFLGLGIQPPTPSWGGMIQEGRDYLDSAWWISTCPGLVLMVTSILVSRTGDRLRDVLDPTLRGASSPAAKVCRSAAGADALHPGEGELTGCDRRAGRAHHHAAHRSRPVSAPERAREPLESERGQAPRASGIPRIRDHEGPRALMQGPEGR
jgi:hypothetical protein